MEPTNLGAGWASPAARTGLAIALSSIALSLFWRRPVPKMGAIPEASAGRWSWLPSRRIFGPER
ncbi:MAG: hypothetical protein K0U75_15570 [Actinomycetia bacterium]|nr:hypothetical protein [Actinomycetes bacterium]